MTSRASCCNGALLRKNITRIWPLWAMLTLVLLVAYPMVLSIDTSYRAEAAVGTVYEITFGFGTVIAAAYAIVSAACLFSYLHNTRSAYMLHAFPVTRDSLFLSNVLSGLLFFLGPWSFTAVGALLILVPYGLAAVKALLLCWVVLTLAYLFFFALAVFCMFLTGKTISGVLIYGVLNFIVITLEYLLRIVIEPALYGFGGLGGALTLPATPLACLMSEGLKVTQVGTEYYDRIYSINWLYLGILAVLGLGLLAAAWALYRRRHMESVGEVITARWLRPIYQVIFSLVGALTIGLLIAELLTDGYIERSLGTLLTCLCFGGFVGHFLAEMRLKKSVKVFRGRAFLRFGGFALVLCLFVLAFYWDWFGIVRRVPETDQVVSVELYNDYSSRGVIVLDTEAEIEEARALHKAILENYDREDDLSGGYFPEAVRMTYNLKDGSTMERVYSLEDMRDSPELLDQATLLLDRPENIAEYYDSIGVPEANAAAVTYWREDGSSHNVILPAREDVEKILSALYQDVAAGNLPVFFRDWDTTRYTVQFYLANGKFYYMDIPVTAVNTRAVLDAIVAESSEE